MNGSGEDVVFAGVDTHKDSHTMVVVGPKADRRFAGGFAADPEGYRELERALAACGRCGAVCVEGTGSYGAGLSAYLSGRGYAVREALSPGRRPYGPSGKTDLIDAEAAALRAMADGGAEPKRAEGAAAGLSFLVCAREGAVKEATACTNAALGLLVRAPEGLKAGLKGMANAARMRALASLEGPLGPEETALRSLARRWEAARSEAGALEEEMRRILSESHPTLLSVKGVGANVAAVLVAACGSNPERFGGEAGFAKMAGVCPVPASSGKTSRHRLNRGGNRQVNKAIHRVALVRLRCDEETRAYVAKRRSEGKTTREAIRCLKRYVARELYRAICAPADAEAAPERQGALLRERREALGASLRQAAKELGADPSTLSKLERGKVASQRLRKEYSEYLGRLERLKNGC